ncbi:MAG TPA: helix-hairpin-helix domain-containing protein [Chitinophagaceae bacterium]|nr:helix-hairpin-helix domain-containing protein [Chitinophagaceae bacterium]
MKWKVALAAYFSFSRKERIAVLAIVFLFACVFLYPTVMGAFLSKKTIAADTAWVVAVHQLEQATDSNAGISYKTPGYTKGHQSTYRDPSSGELFYFDPNTVTAEGWQRLGLRERTVKTILNYIGKGGHFRKAGDLRRVYGLFPDEFDRLAPYIRIVNSSSHQDEPSIPGASASVPDRPHKSRPSVSPIDINFADTSAFIALPGIGSKLAARIVAFREKLGGFYSIAQIGEIYGLQDSTFQQLKSYFLLATPSVRKINVNTATAEILKSHPYIRYVLAGPIISYRSQHGPFSKLEELKNIMAMTDDVYRKLLPYLEL